MKKIVTFDAGFDLRDPNPINNYGIHGLEIKFILKNYKGAVTFIVFTNWLPTKSLDLKWFEVAKDPKMKENIGPMFVTLLINPFIPTILLKPMPADLGYHSPKPIYEEQEPSKNVCMYIGKPCYYDGSALNAIKLFDVLINEGDEGLWNELQRYHELIFGESFIKKIRTFVKNRLELTKEKCLDSTFLRKFNKIKFNKIKFIKEK